MTRKKGKAVYIIQININELTSKSFTIIYMPIFFKYCIILRSQLMNIKMMKPDAVRAMDHGPK
jgi:hypothetical protein